jgi:hypothetical protein
MFNVDIFLKVQSQLRILHWQSHSFSEHKALGKAYDGLDPLIDSFVETYMGKYGKRVAGDFTISLSNYDKAKPLMVLSAFGNYLQNDLPNSLSENDSDLLNIRDEMLSIVNTTKYLLTLS